MMQLDVISSLFEFGALGSTLAILWWSHLKLQERLSLMNAEFAATVAAMRDAQEAKEEKIRDRWSAVLEGAHGDTERLRATMEAKIDAMTQTVNGMSTNIQAGLAEIREQKLHALAKSSKGNK